MIVLDANQTGRLLPYQEIVAAIAACLQEPSETLVIPERLHLSISNGGTFLVMPACDREIGLTKLVTVHPTNPLHGLPSIQGDVLIFEAATGRRLMLLDGPALTAKRTAAVTVFAAQKLSPEPNGSLLLVGCGVQAASHLDAFVEILGTREVFVYSRNKENTASFCKLQQKLLRERHGSPEIVISPAESVDATLAKVSMVVTATTSSEPVLPDELPRGIFVAAVGSYRPDTREISESLMAKATQADALLVVDTEAAYLESGEFALSRLDTTKVRSLRDISNLPHANRNLVIFKSVGHALWDLAAARVAVRNNDLQGSSI